MSLYAGLQTARLHIPTGNERDVYFFFLLLGQVYLCAQLAISDLPND